MKKSALITIALLTLGCAGSIEGYGVTLGMAWGNGAHHCADDKTGPDCLAGGRGAVGAGGGDC